jgi:hypothetical protein
LLKVEPVVKQLANQYGLVCYDPRAGHVQLPERLASPVMHLSGGGIRTIHNPSRSQVATIVREMASRRTYVVLERLPQHYLQVGWGKEAGMTRHGFAVEYRSGGPDQHFRYETTSLGIVADIFDSYVQGDDESMQRYGWQPYEL